MRRGLAALLLGALCACSAVRREEAPSGVDPTFEDAFRALRVAVEERDDELARTILDLVLAREPTGATLRQAQAFDRILEGRALARSLTLRLESSPSTRPGHVDVVLHASHLLEQELVLHCGGGRLSVQQLSIDERGRQQTVSDVQGLEDLRELRIPPAVGLERTLGTFPLDVGPALAVRVHWSLRLGAGEFVHAGRSLPAVLIAAQGCEAVRLAEFLPTATVEPQVLVAYVSTSRFNTPAMLERAVRIPAHRRDEALDLLTPVLVRMDPIDFERVIPALRWLSGHLVGPRETQEWSQWLEERARSRAAPPPVNPLDLPESLGRPQGRFPEPLELPAALEVPDGLDA